MGEMITDVGIDLDGVIYPFADAFRSYCAERLKIVDLPEPTHWNFYEDWGLDSETFNAWLSEAAKSHRVFATQDPYAGVVDAWKDLRDMDVRIHVLTARPQSAWAQTAEWLHHWNLHVDSLHFGPTKGFLSKIATGKAVLLDDHVAYYQEAERAGSIPVLMDRAWNAHLEKANRVKSLPEFVSFIRGFNVKSPTVQPAVVVPQQPWKEPTRRKPQVYPNPYLPKKENPHDPYPEIWKHGKY